MKSFIVTLFLGILLVTGSTFHTKKLNAMVTELAEYNDIITDQLYNDDFDEALASIDILSRKLCDIEPFFATLGNHEELDKIEQNVAELKSFAEGEQKYDAISKAYVVSFLFEHIPKNLQIRIENIL